MLQEWSEGDRDLPARLMPLVYSELRRLAADYLRHERPDHTLQPTALVHEAFVRLSERSQATFDNRLHFFNVAAKIMRRILVDHARRYRAAKRGFGNKLSIDEVTGPIIDSEVDLVELDEALHRLAEQDLRKSQVVELRYFGGLSVEETAEVLDVSTATVKNDWRMARAWLRREMER